MPPNNNNRLIDYATLNPGENDHIKTQDIGGVLVTEQFKPSQAKPKWANVDQSDPALYNYSRGSGGYAYHTGRVSLPLSAATDNGDTVRIVRLARAVAHRTITVDVERVGLWPRMPEPVETYTDGTASSGRDAIIGKLVHVGEALFSSALSGDGVQQIFRITIQYTYALSRPPVASEPTGTVMLPNTTLRFTDTQITRSTVYESALSPQRPALEEE